MEQSSKEYEIIGIDRNTGCITTVWWGHYTLGIHLIDPNITCKEQLHLSIMQHRPDLVRQEGAVFDLIEQMIEESKVEETTEQLNNVSFIDDLLKEMEG